MYEIVKKWMRKRIKRRVKNKAHKSKFLDQVVIISW